ncbi:MAG: DUF2029 domain-containing protein [Chloroflexi bacterium]|nr:DUF2029 domain-containing protein [Chloroflexota bacterium]
MRLSDRGGVLLSWNRIRALRDGLVVAGLLFGVYLFVVVAPAARTFGFDAMSYWGYDPNNPYRLVHGSLGSFVYSPVIAWAFEPFTRLRWIDFLWLWTALLVGSLIWLGGRSFLLLLAFPPVALELYHGNVHILIAVAIALGFRYPATWAFVLLTKATPGVGLLWFLVRREWRPLAIVAGVTGVLVAISLLFDGQLWVQWIRSELLISLEHSPNQPQIPLPLIPRLVAAAALVTWGARTDRRWTVPASAALALPVLWIAGLSILTAIPALARPQLQGRPQSVASPQAAPDAV